jgi:hypothetical protein
MAELEPRAGGALLFLDSCGVAVEGNSKSFESNSKSLERNSKSLAVRSTLVPGPW